MEKPSWLPTTMSGPRKIRPPLPPAGWLGENNLPGSCLRSVWELLPTPSMASTQPGHVYAELWLQRDAEQPQRERKRQHLAGCGVWKQEGNPWSTAPGLQQLRKRAAKLAAHPHPGTAGARGTPCCSAPPAQLLSPFRKQEQPSGGISPRRTAQQVPLRAPAPHTRLGCLASTRGIAGPSEPWLSPL